MHGMKADFCYVQQSPSTELEGGPTKYDQLPCLQPINLRDKNLGLLKESGSPCVRGSAVPTKDGPQSMVKHKYITDR